MSRKAVPRKRAASIGKDTGDRRGQHVNAPLEDRARNPHVFQTVSPDRERVIFKHGKIRPLARDDGANLMVQLDGMRGIDRNPPHGLLNAEALFR